MHNGSSILSRLHAGAQRGEKKTHSVEEQGEEEEERRLNSPGRIPSSQYPTTM